MAAKKPTVQKSSSVSSSAIGPTSSSDLLTRMRAALSGIPSVVEKKMFGGTAFMIQGKMCLTARPERILCRIDPDLYDKAIQKPGCEPMMMKGREYRGYVIVKAEVLKTEKALQSWMDCALDFNQKMVGGEMKEKTPPPKKSVKPTTTKKKAAPNKTQEL